MMESGSLHATIDRDLFPPELIASLAPYRLPFRSRALGRYAGHRRSRRHGDSLEFAGLRPYLPGDDLRIVDWNAYRRLGKLFVRQYEAERNRHISILLDCSGSMGVPHRKFDAARRLAGAIAITTHRDLDHVRVLPFSDHIVEDHVRTARGGVPLELLAYLSSLAPGGGTRLSEAIRVLPHACPRGSVVVIISDCFEDEGFEATMEAIAAHRIELFLLHLLALSDLEPEGRGHLELIDVERGGRCPATLDRTTRRAYALALERWSATIRKEVERIGGRYLRITVDDPVTGVLEELGRPGAGVV